MPKETKPAEEPRSPAEVSARAREIMKVMLESAPRPHGALRVTKERERAEVDAERLASDLESNRDRPVLEASGATNHRAT